MKKTHLLGIIFALLLIGRCFGQEWSTPPASPTSLGTPGQYAADADYFYVCVAPNEWLRAPLQSWTPAPTPTPTPTPAPTVTTLPTPTPTPPTQIPANWVYYPGPAWNPSAGYWMAPVTVTPTPTPPPPQIPAGWIYYPGPRGNPSGGYYGPPQPTPTPTPPPTR